MKYAQKTSVGVDKSKAEIELLLTKYGAQKFASGWDENGATIGFLLSDRYIRFSLPLPKKDEVKYIRHPKFTYRKYEAAKSYQLWEQDCRQKWRALALVIKAKLEAVESGITSFEDEFMAHIVLPNGHTVSEEIKPSIETAYSSGKPLQLLAGY